MHRRSGAWIGAVVSATSINLPHPALAADSLPAAWLQFRDQTQAALDTNDPAQIAPALKNLYQQADRHWPLVALQLLVQNKRYDDVEQHAVSLIHDWRSSTYIAATAEKSRAQSFLAQKKYPEALSAARSYYDVSQLSDCPGAITLLAQVLVVARHDDPRIAKRFKRQQAAWATGNPPAQPTSQPALQSTAPPPDSPPDLLGSPILPTIPPDSKPFEGAAEAIDPLKYQDFVSRGNLFLLEGKAAQARDTFERGEGAAADNQEAGAIENIARAIRAQSGCVGPANAYILQMRNEQQQQ